MPVKMTQIKDNYNSFDLFKEVAMKRLNSIHGREVPFETFDFAEFGQLYVCVGYKPGEELPEEQFDGEALNQESRAAVLAAPELTEPEATEPPEALFTEEEVFGATDEALKLAKEKGIDIANVKGTGKEGNVTKPDVAKYSQAITDITAPEKDNANDTETDVSK